MNIDKLRDSRKQKGLSQEDLANLTNVSRQAVSKWESGQSIPDTDKLVLLSQALDVSVDYLLDNEAMSEQRVRVKLDYNELLDFEDKRYSFEYRSKAQIFGVPLVHVNCTRSYRTGRRKLRVAKGIIAIGDVALGVFSIGLFSLGLFTLGIMSLGLLGLSIIQMGLFSFGIIAIGYSSAGIVALGRYAVGIVAIGKHVAVGVVAIEDTAVGVEAMGKVNSITIQEGTPVLQGVKDAIIKLMASESLPQPMQLVLRMMSK